MRSAQTEGYFQVAEMGLRGGKGVAPAMLHAKEKIRVTGNGRPKRIACQRDW